MSICPLCNGFYKANFSCTQCENLLEDSGRVLDYFGPYSAYMQIDSLKMIDGIPTTLQNNECAHLFYCTVCNNQEIKMIKE
ncbi:hypothetical protein [Bacillus nitroreducens]